MNRSPFPTSVLTLTVAIFMMATMTAVAQVTGEDPEAFDSTIVFESPRPLLDVDAKRKPATSAVGIDLLFSQSGWGLGGFFQTKLADNLSVFAHLGFSGARNTDELENAWYGPIPVVANKVNRLFIVPITAGVQYRLFSESLQESFRPFVSAGISPTFILATPYLKDGLYYEFFSSFGHATSYTRVGGVFGIGSFFGDPRKGSLIGVQLRYFTIPFGDSGLESMRGSPISNFGGVFLSLTVGHQY